MSDLLTRMNSMIPGTLMETLGIEYTVVEEGYIEATMPVGPITHQPMGLLHGGATAALIESIGSGGSAMMIDLSKKSPVGVDINANHMRSATSGTVTGKGKLVHRGRTMHVWQVDVYDDRGRHLTTGRLTNMIVDARP